MQYVDGFTYVYVFLVCVNVFIVKFGWVYRIKSNNDEQIIQKNIKCLLMSSKNDDVTKWLGESVVNE